jgi:hypothetical protein
MTTEAKRRERVAHGSRRKRDLAAVGKFDERSFDFDSFASEHFADERPLAVRMATFQVIARHHYAKAPDPAEVRERLVELGLDREQWDAK